MKETTVATGIILVVLAIVLIQFAGTPLVAQDFPTPTLLVPYATLPPDPVVSTLAAAYPRVDSSTSALPLQRLIACKILGESCIWMDHWAGEAGIWPFDTDMLLNGHEDRISQIRASGVHSAYMNLIAGSTDFILVARPPAQDEIDAADAAGVTFDVRPVARDALVFLVNGDNPRDSFTMDEIRAIYEGAIATWGELGVNTSLSSDPANPIQPYVRDPDSGSQCLVRARVMGDAPMVDAPNLMAKTMIGLISSLDWDRAGIGYSVYYYTVYIAPGEHIKLVAMDGIAPTPFTIANGSYPLVTDVHAVIRADAAADSPARRLRDWLLTTTGQEVVKESGYVPLTTG